MSLDTLAVIALVFAAFPAGLFVLNLLVYRPLPPGRRRQEALSGSPQEELALPCFGRHGVSVLIPARNEERNIRTTLDAVLTNLDCNLEVIVLDDHSTDCTADIVKEFAARDPRLRLESAPPLPAGWCGKQHACHVLAKLARNPLLVFIDADVRLAPDALARMAWFMEQTDAALASGVRDAGQAYIAIFYVPPLLAPVLATAAFGRWLGGSLRARRSDDRPG
jgi:glycosyltransferase involved in cell wall biosynthesis